VIRGLPARTSALKKECILAASKLHAQPVLILMRKPAYVITSLPNSSQV
jgi:hypothetical protein